MMPVSFSVVVPVHDGARFLMEALESVAAQQAAAWDCIVVDDASSDGSFDLAARWARSQGRRTRVLRHVGTPRGVAATRNLGIRRATSAWVAFLDQDDVWTESKLAEQASVIEADPDVPAVGCLPTPIFDGMKPLPIIERWVAMIRATAERRGGRLGLRDFVAGCPYCLSGVVARRAALLEHGGFDSSLPRTSDWFMWAKLTSRAPVALIPRPLVSYRLHGRNELLRLADTPLGLAGAFLEMRSLLTRWLMADRGLSGDEASSYLDALIREAALELCSSLEPARTEAAS